MKKNKLQIVILTLLFIFFTKTIYAQNWVTDFEQAKKIAIATNKLILVDFWATWCGPCKKMESDVWSKPQVKELLNNFVPLKINIDMDKKTALLYGIHAIPQILMIDPNGKTVFQELGYKNVLEIEGVLKKYNINLFYAQNQLINYYKKKSASNALRLANKYQIMAIVINKNIKSDILNIANSYLTDALKELHKNKNTKKELIQKIKLLKIRANVILNKPKKALKKINKLAKRISDTNQSLFSFINYVSSKQLKQDENAKDWYLKLNEKDKKLAELILNNSKK